MTLPPIHVLSEGTPSIGTRFSISYFMLINPLTRPNPFRKSKIFLSERMCFKDTEVIRTTEIPLLSSVPLTLHLLLFSSPDSILVPLTHPFVCPGLR